MSEAMQKTEGVYWIVTAYYFRQISNTKVNVSSGSAVLRAETQVSAQNIYSSHKNHKEMVDNGFSYSVSATPLRGFYFDPANPPG